MTNNPLERDMSYIEILDFRAQEHQHQMELEAAQAKRLLGIEKQRTRQSRRDVYITLLVGLFIAAVVLGIAYAIYKGTRPGPYSNQPSQSERRELACMENGGTWLPGSMLRGTPDNGVCVLPGASPK